MNNKNRIIMNRARNGMVIIDIEGTIGVPEDWQFEAESERVATYERFRTTLEQMRNIDASEVRVNIRSRGGNVEDALLIYEALSTLPARVETHCHGYVASAATIIAQAGDCRKISTGTLYLVHRATMMVEGNSAEVMQASALLGKTDERIAQIYADRSGMPIGEFHELMSRDAGRGEWLSPEEAVAAGLADEVVNLSYMSRIGRKIKDLILPSDATMHETHNRVADESRDVFDLSERQTQVQATQTLPKEDPVIDILSPKLAPNKVAYNQDVAAFKSTIV